MKNELDKITKKIIKLLNDKIDDYDVKNLDIGYINAKVLKHVPNQTLK